MNKTKSGYRSIATSLQDNLAGLSAGMIDEHMQNALDDGKEEEKQLKLRDDIDDQYIDIHPTPLKKTKSGYRSLQDNLDGRSLMIDEHIKNVKGKSISDDDKDEEKQSDDIYTTHLNHDYDEVITQQASYIPLTLQPKQSIHFCPKSIIRCPKRSIDWSIPKVKACASIVMKYIAVVDMITDINLLYSSFQAECLFLTVTLILSIIAPYLLQYSCGIKLFTLRRTFERLAGFRWILVALFLLPTGVLYFVFLDIYDLFINVKLSIQLFCCCRNVEELKEVEVVLVNHLAFGIYSWQ
eukprot:546074_1